MALEKLFKSSGRSRAVLSRFHRPPLGPKMETFCEWLCAQQFSLCILRRRIWQVSHFNQYLRRLGVKGCRDVETAHAQRFISKHLPRCRCRGPGSSRHVGTPAAVYSLIDYLSSKKLLATTSETPPLYQELLEEYLDYLKRDRNLAETTIREHQRYLVPFLKGLGADATASRLCKLSPGKVQTFLVKHGQNRGMPTRREIHSVLRIFFRFCVKQGYLHRDLAQAIPKVHMYKLSHVPRGISDEDAQKVLDSIDRTTAVGRRDLAIIQMLCTYGVRGGEVRALRLRDIQWRQNRIRFQTSKGGKDVIEPLTDEVGATLLDYLRHGRPQVACEEVFIRAVAPLRPLGFPGNVSAIVARRMRRAGVAGPIFGPHTFRHGFATRMLKSGQSFKTISDMLGHRDINTTFIYTKVDLEMLRQVPLDWPEV